MPRVRFLPLVLALTVKSWAQVPPPASPIGVTEDNPAGVATEQAMAASAFLAMKNLTGVPTTAPAAAVAPAPDAPIIDDGIHIGTTLNPLQPTEGEVVDIECKVLAGSAGKVMQVILFLCCCGVLALKFHREAGDRTASEFIMDSTKQLCGAGWIHVLNICFAKGLESQYQAGDECTWYWLNIVLDCTLGVAVEYVLMLGLTACIKSAYPSQAGDFETGDYKSADGSLLPARYIKQLILWLLIVTLMKGGMVLIMTVGHESLSSIAKAMLSPFAFDATFKLFAVMILTPICMNAFQFWMVDNFIKKSADGSREDPSAGDMEYDGSMRTRIQHGGL